MKTKNKSAAKGHQKKDAPKIHKKLLQKIATKKNWDDLAIDETTKQQLDTIRTWIKNGNTADINNKDVKPGQKVVFSGLRGTGKKLAAKLLGKEDNRTVYRIDISQVISKYIGETEKNLAKIFDDAKEKNWILFFDEADALFGKRTEVSDAHDRYKDQEISYLLQRIEEYPGLAIFSSAKPGDPDNVFAKHFNTVIHFKKHD